MSSRARSPLVLLLLVSSCHVHSGLVPTGMSPLVRLFLSYLRSVFSCPVLLSCWLLSCLLMSCLLSSPLVLSTLVLSRRSLGAFWRAVGASWKPLRSLWGDLLAAPGRPLGPFWRLLSGSWSSLGGSKVALCRKARIRRQYSVFRGFLGLRELTWRLLRPSWGSLGGPWGPPGGSWVA